MIKLSIKSKLQVMLLVASLGSILIVGFLSWNKANGILTDRIFSELTVVRTSKAYQIESYLDLFRKQIETLCENPMVVEAMKEFNPEFAQLKQASISSEQQEQVRKYYEKEFLPRLEKNIDGAPVYETYDPTTTSARYLQYHHMANNPNPVGEKDQLEKADDNSKYSEIHEKYHYLFRNLIERFGYYDLFLIDAETGDIVYSVYKETDYATSLYTGPYRNSNLAKIAEQVENNPDRGAIQLIDFEFYRPSYNAPAAFIAGPIYDGTNRVGILAVQLPIDEINQILTYNKQWQSNGLGKTGETYLVGEDLRLRSISRPFLEDTDNYLRTLRKNKIREKTVNLIELLETPVLIQPVETVAAKEAIKGRTGTQIIKGYGSQKVLSSYAPLTNVDGVNWGIISEISLSEAYAPLKNLQRYLLVWIVILILLVTLLAAIAARRFTQPIDTMIRRFRNLGTDEIPNWELTSNDEFSELAEILNTIGKRVRILTKAIMKQEQEKETLLSNILPPLVVERWQKGEKIVDRARVAIIVIRVAGLEKTEQRARKVARAFNELVTSLDSTAERMDVERLNCFAETYIAACGLTKPRLDRVKRSIDFANSALSLVKEINRKHNLKLNLRIGIDTGSITAAVIGEQKFRYDLWGEPVDVATQLAQRTEANTIRVTKTINDRLAKDLFAFEADNSITLLDKRTLPTWVLGKNKRNLVNSIVSGINFNKDNELGDNRSSAGESN